MKNILLIMLTSLLSITLLSCYNVTTEPTTANLTTNNPVQTIELYSINDMHGLAYSDLETLSRMGKYLHDKNENVANTIIVATGDMLQGSAFSNY
ncbi:MAG: hypothetical protein PHQ30_06390, partial [Candidatus Izemoplasmatales bacterium]|nr:hypothetical protein [Candidatus Izemoplasmatales bacterium]